jgi:hypothetical protein
MDQSYEQFLKLMKYHLHHRFGVTRKANLQEMLARERQQHTTLEIIQGAQAAGTHDDPIGVIVGTSLNDQCPLLERLSRQTLGDKKAVKRLLKKSQKKIKELEASLEMWDFLMSEIERNNRDNDNQDEDDDAGGNAPGLVVS